jgi:predicted RNase H-like HicB family nuclease
MRYYIGLIHKDAASDYGVSFPDFPGVATAGKSLDDAQAMAEEALALHLDGLVEDGEPLPKPSTLDAVMELPDSKGALLFVLQ